jgi:hypothetical protein
MRRNRSKEKGFRHRGKEAACDNLDACRLVHVCRERGPSGGTCFPRPHLGSPNQLALVCFPSSSVLCVVLLCSGTIARQRSRDLYVQSEGPRSLMHEKEADVSSLDEWKAVLVKDFLELQRLEGQDASTRMRRSMKEQEIWQHCCQAGEHLGDPDLALLKKTLRLDDWQWQRYRAKVRPALD